ncbi:MULTISPECIES: hypothetical protein [Aeromonas]|uniref:hypothetical protein n=1 Tax=Aeromonas TaxID=642 RepID=UPI0018828074|nr:hypothetical protein [Aeromonas veronii]MBE8745299.1 hypothetical protein [Aeromonas veronii]
MKHMINFILKKADKFFGGVMLMMMSFHASAAGTGKGVFGWAADVVKEQGQYGMDMLGTGMQLLGFVLLGWAVFMVVKHNLDQKKGNTPDTSWKLVGVLIICGAISLGFGSWVDMADSTAWGSSGGNSGKIQIQ